MQACSDNAVQTVRSCNLPDFYNICCSSLHITFLVAECPYDYDLRLQAQGDLPARAVSLEAQVIQHAAMPC